MGEVKRRTRVVGVFPRGGSLVNLARVVMLRVTGVQLGAGGPKKEWAFRRYMDKTPLWGA